MKHIDIQRFYNQVDKILAENTVFDLEMIEFLFVLPSYINIDNWKCFVYTQGRRNSNIKSKMRLNKL